MRGLVRAHPEMAAVVGLGSLLRIAASIAYWPGLFFSDSWEYLHAAYLRFPAGVVADRPSGYPVLMRLLMLPGRKIGIVITAQHLAGVATGVLTYALACRAGVGRRWAALLAALVLLDVWTVALEQRLLAEAFFTLVLIIAGWLAVRAGARARWAAAAGALVGIDVTLRPVALFAAPALIVYLLWDRRALRPALMAAGGIALVLVCYGVAHQRIAGSFALTDADGWFLYGRVAEFADCDRSHVPADTRFLCEPRNAPDRAGGAGFYIWNSRSPARRRYPHISTPGSNHTLGRFARAVLRDQPGDYVSAVVGDFFRFFEPGAKTPRRSRSTLVLPAKPGEGVDDNLTYRAELLPGYSPPARPPARVLHAIGHWLHYPRPLLGLFALAALAAVVVGLFRPAAVPNRTQILLFAGLGLGQLIGAVATSDFVLRYLLPAAPLLALAGAIAISDLLRWRRTTARG